MALARTYATLVIGAAATRAFQKGRTIKSETVQQSASEESELRPQMRLYAHRGASASRPENTLAAFAYAFDCGAAGVECDTHAVIDGIVVLHDKTLRRTGSHPSNKEVLGRPIKDLTVDEINGVDVGTWMGPEFAGERVPTYEDFLVLVAAKRGSCFVELKGHNSDSIKRLAALTRANALGPGQLVFIGFDISLMSTIKAAAPEYSCYGIANIQPCGIRWLDKWRALAFARRCKEAGLDGIDLHADPRIVTPELVADLRSRGLKCAVWVKRAPSVLDMPEVWKAMEDAGVEIFTSNCPEEAFAWWRSRQPSE